MTVEGSVDDLLVFVEVGDAAGEGQAFTCFSSDTEAGLPAVGRLVFHEDLLNQTWYGRGTKEGFYYDLARHELAHVLGFIERYLRPMTRDMLPTDSMWPYDESPSFAGPVRVFMGEAATREFMAGE